MTSGDLLDLWRQAITTIAAVSAPFLVTGLALGLVIAVLQTATQLQESILSFVPKLIAALIVLAVAGHWTLDKLNRFTTDAFTAHVSPPPISSAPP